MSNSRIFCWTWMICHAAAGVYSLLGFPEKYSGIEGMIAQFILSTAVAISMVAVAGDQKAKP